MVVLFFVVALLVVGGVVGYVLYKNHNPSVVAAVDDIENVAGKVKGEVVTLVTALEARVKELENKVK